MVGLLKSALAVALTVAASVGAVPADLSASQLEARQATYGAGYWMETIKRQGAPAFGTSGYKVFRNVKDYGAKG